MRNPKRIEIIKALLEKEGNLKTFFDNLGISDLRLTKFQPNSEEFFEYWRTYPDMRMMQAFDNYFGENTGFWNCECFEVMKESKIEGYRNVLLWKSIGKGPRSITELTTSHIENILKDYNNGKQPLNGNYLEAFKDELNERKKNG